MAVRCLTGARFNMEAEILRPISNEDLGETPVPGGSEGHWEEIQDPITGEILNKWVPGQPDDPDTPDVDESEALITIPCMARGIVDGGIRVAGTTERFGDTYENIDFVKLWTPSWVRLSKRDRVTNIRDRRNGRVIWLDEEHHSGDEPPTIFSVNGVTPLFDAFNRHIENFVLLEKVQ